MKKISELTTQSFLGGTNVPANSYILINYADSNVATPVTKKVSVQELGKAIANDLKLPSVTVSEGAITNFKVKGVSNGAYTETVVEAPQNNGDGGMSVFESVMIPAETAGDPSISTYVVTTDEDKFYIANDSNATPVFTTYHKPVIVYDSSSDGPFGYYESYSSEIHYIPVPSMGDVNDAVDTAISGLASDGYVTRQIDTATSLLASTGYVDSAVNGLASTGYVTNAISGLASTGDVADAITDALDNIPGGTGTINLTDSYPFANTSGIVPASFDEANPKSLLVFAPFTSDMVGPPYIQLPGQNTATPVNLAGPFQIQESGGGAYHTCANIFVDYENQQISTLDSEYGQLADINSNYVGNLIKLATVDDDNTQDLHPLFIDTNNNTIYYFKNSNWQTVSL